MATGDPSVDALYEQVRTAVPVVAAEAPGELLPVAPGIRVLALRTPTLPPAAHTNTYVVGPERGPQVVVDPGSPYPDQQAILDAVIESEAGQGRPPGTVLLTHHHGDHVGGAAALAKRWGVPIAAHANTARRLAGKVTIERELADQDELPDVGITCVFTPGHADGHLVFEKDGAQLAGDMVAGLGTILIDPNEGNMGDYLASLTRMLERAPTLLLPAHGPSITDAAGKLREYIAHRTMREDRVVAALRARTDAALADLVADVYTDTPRILWPLAERSLMAHLNKLAQEGRARDVGQGRWTLA